MAGLVTELKARKDMLVTKGVEQENLKTTLKDKAVAVKGGSSDLYDTFSTKIDSALRCRGQEDASGQTVGQAAFQPARPEDQ